MSPFKHTPEQARAAVAAALASGNYKQAQCGLCRLDADGQVEGYCCLGVACEVFQQLEGGLDVRDQPGRRYYDTTSTRLPSRLVDWLGFRTDSGELPAVEVPESQAPIVLYSADGHRWTNLMLLNDQAGWTFDQIAALFANPPAEMLAGWEPPVMPPVMPAVEQKDAEDAKTEDATST